MKATQKKLRAIGQNNLHMKDMKEMSIHMRMCSQVHTKRLTKIFSLDVHFIH